MWIDVKDRLPDYNISVLGYTGECFEIVYFSFKRNAWSMNYNFTHWQPLPEPPTTSNKG